MTPWESGAAREFDFSCGVCPFSSYLANITGMESFLLLLIVVSWDGKPSVSFSFLLARNLYQLCSAFPC